MAISDHCYIQEGAQLGKNVSVDAFTSIAADVEIGEGTWIGPHVTIMDGVRIGSNCKVFPGSVLGAIPQDLKFEGEQSLVHIAHDCIIGEHAVLVNNVNLAGHVEIGKYAIVGGLTAIHQFVKIGDYCMIGGGSLVRKDVPPFTKAAREPLSYVGVNSIGLRRRGFSTKQINHIQDIYRILFVKGHNTTQGINIIEATVNSTAEREQILRFLTESDRGIMRGFRPS